MSEWEAESRDPRKRWLVGSLSDRWQRLQDVFEHASTLPADERTRYLEGACGTDRSLRTEVEAMLAAESAQYALGIERLVNDAGEPVADPLIGMRLGAWRVLQPLGRGGMAAVYLAERADGHYEQRVALKVGASTASHAAALFQAERRILARLTHPNIAHLLDAGFTPLGAPFMVMELVDGAPITTWCDARRLSVEERLRLFLVACHATQHAHQALVVHRDLKPSNIFVSADGEVKLLDFGIAKLLEPDAGSDYSTREHRAATLAYAAPEQLRGEPVTTATDVYALGVVLYELLAGRRPCVEAASSALDVERLVSPADPVPPSQAVSRDRAGAVSRADAAGARGTTPAGLVKRLRGDLDRIVLQALHPEPGRRYVSAGQLAEDIERCLAGRPVRAQPDSLAYRARRFAGRHRLAVSAAGALVIVLAVFSAMMALQARRIAVERDRAQIEQRRAERMVRLLVDLFETANPDVVPGGERLAVGEFLERAELRALRELEQQPELVGRMRHVLGQVHHARSNYARARELLQTALEEQRRVTGPDSREAIDIQIDLARVLGWIGEGARARELVEEGLARVLRAHAGDELLEAESLHALATVVTDRRQAQGYLERAAGIGRQRLPPTDSDRIRYTSSLAVAHLRAREFDAARLLFDEAREGAEAINGGRSTILIAVLNDSAALDSATGDFAAAEAKHRRTLGIATDLLGPDSFQVANALNNLAVALASQDRLREAADAFRRAYDRHVALFGDDHWRTINTMRNVGMMALLMDEPKECEGWMARAVKGSLRIPGNERAAQYMRAQLARCVVRDGRIDEGIALLEPTILSLAGMGAATADYTANARVWLGRALLDAGRLERALALAEAAVDHYRRSRSPEHPARAEAECHLAEVLAARGREDDARPLLEACVPRIEHYGQMEPWRRQSARQLRERLRATPVAAAAFPR
jgi:serine/threonine-protein kinase